jgi:hypothetical protein
MSRTGKKSDLKDLRKMWDSAVWQASVIGKLSYLNEKQGVGNGAKTVESGSYFNCFSI